MLIPSLHSIKLQPHIKFGLNPSKSEAVRAKYVFKFEAKFRITKLGTYPSNFDGSGPNFT